MRIPLLDVTNLGFVFSADRLTARREPSIHRKYLLLVLSVLLAFNLTDGLALGLLLQSIKRDLSLSDTQLGLLTGIAFALFYSVMGIPIARWADRGNRITIIAVTTTLWSVAVFLCGLAQSFAQLLTIRIAVAVGEAGCVPAGTSLIASHFDRAERPRAMARYMLAAPLSSVIGYLVAGWLNEVWGWRLTFFSLGVSGLILAAIVWLTLDRPREDRSSMSHSRRSDEAVQRTLREICGTLWKSRTFRHLLLSYAIMTFCGNGTTQWLSTFFIRSYGIGTGELGSWFGVIYGTGGALGAYLGGELSARYAARNECLQISMTAWLYVGLGVTSALVYAAPNQFVAFGLIWINSLCAALSIGPLLAVIQSLVPESLRAQAIAIVFFVSNLIGMGLGPLAVGALSDALYSRFAEQSLRIALLALTPTYLWIAWHLWQGSKTVRRDIEATETHGAFNSV